jgi:hypothetical protein
MADHIRNYFHHTEGRSNNCKVEAFRRGDLDYFFAYPEDYSQQSIEWVDGEFDRRPHNPAFEVIYVYSQKDGSAFGSALVGKFAHRLGHKMGLKKSPASPSPVRLHAPTPGDSRDLHPSIAPAEE